MLSTRSLGLFLFALLGFHLWLNLLLPLGVDEAHYALYGWYLDWSYFDHPPLIGWLEAPAVHGLDADWAVRLVPMLLGVVILWQLVRLAESLFTTQNYIGVWVLFLVLWSPLLHGLTLTPLPDLPLLLVSVLLVRYLWSQRHHERLAHPWLLGVLMGLAGLSKYTAVTLVMSFVLVMLLYGRWRWLKQPGLWGAVGLALLLIAPVIYWNVQHGWASFLYQLDHGAPQHVVWSLERFLISQGRQAGAYGIVLYGAVLGLLIWSVIRWKRLPEGVRFLWLFALPVFLLFAWSSGYEPILPHWTGLGWWLIIPAVAWFLANRAWVLWLHGVIGGMIWIGVLALLLGASWPFKAPNPMLELAGWKQASDKLDQWQHRLLQQEEAVLKFAGNWSLVSRPAWYLRHRQDPRVFNADGRPTQFDFWYDRPPKEANGVVLWHSYFNDQAGPAGSKYRHFERCRLLERWPVTWHGQPINASFSIFFCQQWRHGH